MSDNTNKRETLPPWLMAVVLLAVFAMLLTALVMVSDHDTQASGLVIALASASVPTILTTLIAVGTNRAVKDVQRKVNGELDKRIYTNAYYATRNAVGTGRRRSADGTPDDVQKRRKV